MNESLNADDDLFDRPDEPDQTYRVSINSQAINSQDQPSRSPQERFDVFRYTQQVGQSVEDMGRQMRSPHQGFDGYDLTGSSLRALGSFIQAGAAIAKNLNLEDQNQQRWVESALNRVVELDDRINNLTSDQNQQRRVESAVERVVDLDDRINNLTSDQPIDNAKRETPKPIPAPQKRNAAAPAPIPPDQTLDGIFNPALQQIDQQLDNLDKQAGISSDRPLITINSSLSINQKLDLIEQVLDHLSDRVDRLEQAFMAQQTADNEINEENRKEVSGIAIKILRKTKSNQVDVDNTKINFDQESRTLTITETNSEDSFKAHVSEGKWRLGESTLSNSQLVDLKKQLGDYLEKREEREREQEID